MAKSEQMDKKAPEQEEEENEEEEANTSGMSDVSKSFVEGRVEDVMMWPPKRQTQESQDCRTRWAYSYPRFFSNSGCKNIRTR